MKEAGLKAEVLSLRSPKSERPLPVQTVLVIDHSGSMFGEPLQAAKDAANTFVGMMRSSVGDQTEVIAFHGIYQVLVPFSQDATGLTERIDTLQADDGTQMYDPLYQALSDLESLSQAGRKIVLLLSDGMSAPGSVTSDQIIEKARGQAIAIYCVGLGEADENQLRPLADGTRGEYVYAPQPADLQRIYARIAGSLQSEYSLTYRSPNPLNDGTQRDVVIRLKGERLAARGSFYRPGVVVLRSHSGLFIALLSALLTLLFAPSLPRWMGLKGRRTGAVFIVLLMFAMAAVVVWTMWTSRAQSSSSRSARPRRSQSMVRGAHITLKPSRMRSVAQPTQPAPTARLSDEERQWAQDALDLINAARTAHPQERRGRGRLTLNEPLSLVARAHARDMVQRGYMAHVSPEGTTPADRILRAGIAWTACAENIAGDPTHQKNNTRYSGFATLRQAHDALMNEPPFQPNHRGNILGDFDEVGIGVARNPDGTFVMVEEFIRQ